MKTERGVVVSPGFRPYGPNGFSVDTSGINNLLRNCLLYWDKIEWPSNTAVDIGGSPDIDFLLSAGVLQRTNVQIGFSGDITPVIARAQLAVFDQLERSQPGMWSIAQDADVLRFPGQNVAKSRAIEFQLFQVLPVPYEGVPFEDILEFRARYAPELGNLRLEIDQFYARILNAQDHSREWAIVVGRLHKVLEEVEKALDGAKLKRQKIDLSVAMKLSEPFEKAMAGAGFAQLAGLPVSVGAAVGAILGSINIRSAEVLTPPRVRSGPFAYLYRTRRELAVQSTPAATPTGE